MEKKYLTQTEKVLKCLDEEIKYLDELRKTNPKEAKRVAHNWLVSMGYIDEDGNILPPYNGQKVNEDDFTMGPGEI